MEKILNYINGELVEPKSNEWIKNINPANGKHYSNIPLSGQSDVNEAVEAAKKSFPAWSTTPAGERSAIMARLADLVAKNAQELARAESIDNGKPISLAAHVDIPRAESNIRFSVVY